MKIEKRIDIVNKGYTSTRELYAPNCEVSRLVTELYRGYKQPNLVIEDIYSFKKAGWEIHYTGKKSSKLPLVDAIYDGAEKKE